jgi:hypothetical protein
MEANIIQGIYLKVGGEAGRTNGLPWHILERMFGHLQELIELLAKYELETDLSPNLKAFEIEIFDFRPGSAIPAFRIVPSLYTDIFQVIEPQKEVVANRFDSLMSLANKGAYENFFDKDGLPEVRHEIGEELNGFILSADNSPISIVEPNIVNGTVEYKEIYKIPKFNKRQSEFILKPRARRKQAAEPEEFLVLIQRIGKKKKIFDMYDNKDTILSISPDKIILADKIYYLHAPLSFNVQKEDGNFLIENKILDLYACGESIDEAEHDLYKEFDESYKLLNGIPDNELSDRLLRARNVMNLFIKEIINE